VVGGAILLWFLHFVAFFLEKMQLLHRSCCTRPWQPKCNGMLYEPHTGMSVVRFSVHRIDGVQKEKGRHSDDLL
jgi:hypothetical protein